MTNGLKLSQVPEIVCAPEDPTDRERIETDIIKSLILSYFNIVKRNICDLVPKAIMNLTVNAAKDSLQKELVTQLYRQDLFLNLLKEPDDISERRNTCKEMLAILHTATDVIAQIRDFNLAVTSSDVIGSRVNSHAPAPHYTSITGLKPVDSENINVNRSIAASPQKTWEGM
jgi:hypothetical protein